MVLIGQNKAMDSSKVVLFYLEIQEIVYNESDIWSWFWVMGEFNRQECWRQRTNFVILKIHKNEGRQTSHKNVNLRTQN